MPKIILSLFLIAILGGVVTVLASNSLPGDPLYSFKTNVSEKTERTLALDDTAKAAVSVTLAQERLSEFQTLLLKGTLTSGAETQLAGALDTHMAEFTNSVHILLANGKHADALAAVQNFQTAVSVQIAALSTLDPAKTPLLPPFITHLQTILDSLSTLSGSITTAKK